MKAMILAAGRGERLRPITDTTPKPLLKVQDKTLIEYHILKLAQIGINEIVINISYQADKIRQYLGAGKQYGVTLHYSFEEQALETGGGILQALPYFRDEPFIVLSADIYTDFPLESLPKQLTGLAHLILVDNPPYHPRGDFTLTHDQIGLEGNPKYTFGNISVLSPKLFEGFQAGIFPLVQALTPAIPAQQVTGSLYQGEWYNVGSLEIYRELQAKVANPL